MSRKTLYIAAPYTHPDPVVNANAAIRVATFIYENTEYLPVVPHVSLLWHMVTPRPPQFWYDLTLEQMLTCDAILRLPGHSTGADNEMRDAKERGIELVRLEPHILRTIDTIWASRSGALA